MDRIGLILLVFGFVLFVLAAFNVSAKWNLIAAGLAFWILTEILFGAVKVFH